MHKNFIERLCWEGTSNDIEKIINSKSLYEIIWKEK